MTCTDCPFTTDNYEAMLSHTAAMRHEAPAPAPEVADAAAGQVEDDA